MKTRKLILVAAFIAIASSLTLTAHAGLMDWFKSNGVGAENGRSGSFDQLYASVLTSGQPAKNDKELVMTANALMAANSPVGGIQKTTRRTMWVQMSGYNSEVGQTDDSPFITAANTHVRWGIVAANIIDARGYNIPFGTVIKIPSMFGDQIFVVEDRMNRRYTNNVDVWFEHKSDALKFGRRTLEIEIIR